MRIRQNNFCTFLCKNDRSKSVANLSSTAEKKILRKNSEQVFRPSRLFSILRNPNSTKRKKKKEVKNVETQKCARERKPRGLVRSAHARVSCNKKIWRECYFSLSPSLSLFLFPPSRHNHTLSLSCSHECGNELAYYVINSGSAFFKILRNTVQRRQGMLRPLSNPPSPHSFTKSSSMGEFIQ